MKQSAEYFDSIVLGSGISGMTMALLLADSGQKVLLLEKGNHIGGSMQRFTRRGVPFDTGFHFTAGFGDVMTQMLQVLEIEEFIEPRPFSPPGGTRLRFADEDEMLQFPGKREELIKLLVKRFPDEEQGVREFFRAEEYVFRHTPSMDITKLGRLLENGSILDLGLLKEDFITLEEYFQQHGLSTRLRTVLAMFAMCHGTPPSEISFANHCRVSYGLHNGITQVKRGGDAFIDAFKTKASQLKITIRCRQTITGCNTAAGRSVDSVQLSDGSEIQCRQVILAIHPREILSILPEEYVSKLFRQRVEGFEDSFGFFSLHAITREHIADFPIALTSYFSSPDISRIMSPEYRDSGMAIMTTTEETERGIVQVVNAFDAMWLRDCRPWRNASNRRHNSGYQRFKAEYAARMINNIECVYPQFKDRLEVLETATILTFNDYLHNGGAAYGIKQKLGQFNLFGKLPVRNFYAIGQNSLLPGVLGAMLSAFIMSYKIIGAEKFSKLIKRVKL